MKELLGVLAVMVLIAGGVPASARTAGPPPAAAQVPLIPPARPQSSAPAPAMTPAEAPRPAPSVAAAAPAATATRPDRMLHRPYVRHSAARPHAWQHWRRQAWRGYGWSPWRWGGPAAPSDRLAERLNAAEFNRVAPPPPAARPPSR